MEFFKEPEFQKSVTKVSSGRKKDVADSIKKQIEASFKRYAQGQLQYSNYKALEEELLDCLDENGKVDPNKVKEFHAYLESNNVPKHITKFDRFVTTHTKTVGGHTHWQKAMAAHQDLLETNPRMNEENAFSSLHPENFGATITGFISPKRQDEVITKLGEHSKHYSPIFSPVADKAVRYVNSPGGKRKTLAALVLAASLGVPTVVTYNHAMQYTDLTTQNAVEQGYDLDISESTQDSLKQIRQELEALKKSPTLPTEDQLLSLRSKLDDNMDSLYEDLVAEAFKDKYPDSELRRVETRYDLNNYEHQQWIEVEYLDKNGNPQTEEVSSFDSNHPVRAMMIQKFGNKYSTVGGSLNEEINFDKYFYTILDDAYADGLTFEEQTKKVKVVLDFLDTALESEEIIGAKKATYKKEFLFKNSAKISLEMPDKRSDDDLEH